ncbi:unnamed protein product [Lymnaea stagnalis]|uniref:WH2 domain-containing protein n=1 Tax=Lymnaea stagnalis TaxID=6523 RepID=A0AAV2I293_LYMST
MLKWTKSESKSMSGAVKHKATAPMASTPPRASLKKGVEQNGNSSGLRYPAEVSDDVNMNEVDGPVTLDVTLPSGQRTDISVDYNTPMLDLLVSVAGQCKLNPSGLTLQLLAEDTGKPLAYKPNQTIGALGGRMVRILTKDEISGKSKNRSSNQDKPFEVTHRFTVNLPRGQKTVQRVSPAMTLGELVTSVCQDKGLDQRRHVLQIPGKPGVLVDPGTTVQQVGVYEMNLINIGSGLEDRSHTVSMPDLSQAVPKEDRLSPLAPPPTEQKKRRGFLSFLSKKDRKYKPEVRHNSETSSNTNPKKSSTPAQQSLTPPSERRGSDLQKGAARPKSMFVMSSPQGDDNTSNTSKDSNQVALAPKKRRAPAPPVPAANHAPQLPSVTVGLNQDNKTSTTLGPEHNSPSVLTTSSQDATSAISVSSQQVSRAELLNRLHSRNSSDSSGYHELTLSGCESPEAAYHNVSKFKTSIDSTSIESAENANGDSGIQEPSSRISPIVEDQELQSKPLVKQNTDTLPSKKKRKAPAPPPPVPSTTATPSMTVAHSATPATSVTPALTVSSAPSTPSLQVESAAQTIADSTTESLVSRTQSESTTTNSVTPISTPTTTPTTAAQSTDSLQSPPIADVTDYNASSLVRDNKEAEIIVDAKNEDESDDSDVETNDNSAFDINEILAGVVFDEEPKTIDLRIAPSSRVTGQERDEMMMMETASITSEDIEQIVVSSHTERPCAFIPPPPPTEPPPPVESDRDIPFSDYKKFLVDKGTELNEDNTSLAPSSAKSSPGMVHRHRDSIVSIGSTDTIESLTLDFEQTIHMGEEAIFHDSEATSGYKNEMAMFVERMSKIAIANTLEPEIANTDDTISMSIPGSDTNSETGSVIQHNRSDSKDSRSESEAGSLSRREGKKISGGGLLTDLDHEWHDVASPVFAMTEEITVPLETVPPPPDFNDEREISKNTSEDEEEFYSEIVEELIIPLGPNGYDFTAAVKVPIEEPVKEVKPVIQNENITGVFRAEPLSIMSMSHLPTLVHHSQPKPAVQSTQKEEFVLTTEDLSSVSFLPPKARRAKPIPEPVPLVHISTTSLVIDKSLGTNDVSKGKLELPGVASGQHKDKKPHDSKSKAESSIKTYPLQNMPSMRISKVDGLSSYSDYDQPQANSDPIVTRSTPRLLMNSNTASHGSSSHKAGVDNVDGAYGRVYSEYHSSSENSTDSDGMKHSESSSSMQSIDVQEQQEALQSQYFALQAQFSQWKEQLARNQSILASQTDGKEQQTEAKQLAAQMAKQQKMMDDIQATIMAMQQQGQVEDLEARPIPLSIPASKPLSTPVTKPLTTVAKQVILTNTAPLKSANAAAKPKTKPKFEPELDPREELMIAIRNFNGREGLRTVPVNKTHWVQGNR